MGRVRTIWTTMLWVIGVGCCLGIEWVRLLALGGRLPERLTWCGEFLFDTPMFLPLFLVWPLCYWVTSGFVLHRSDLLRTWLAAVLRWSAVPSPSNQVTTAVATGASRRAHAFDWGLSLLIAGVSLLNSHQSGRPLENLPPAYHDEYSYLFQARTLLAGELSFPSHPAVAPIFDQLHVVNQGRFASRYYPGTGAWLAPWVAAGHPIWGQWLAGSLAAMLIFWTGWELGGRGVGLLAGMLTALSPGVNLFGQTLLAHHPTLLGLTLFLHGFAAWMIRRKSAHLFEAGCGLAFAMLCRPVTAAGVALPFGIWLAWEICKNLRSGKRLDWKPLLLLGLPLLAGWIAMAEYNHSITGSWLRSPYELYTDVYTPRHVYGFNNVDRGTAALGDRLLPAVTRNYDVWAENLTPVLALRNVEQRLVASLRWILGILPLAWIVLASCWLPLGSSDDSRRSTCWTLIAMSIVSLHLIHVPYWFDGIMHWHYVFESSVLWLLLAARGTIALLYYYQSANRPWLAVWVVALLATAVGANFVAFPPFWETRQSLGMAELRFPRKIYGDFQRRITAEVTERPALVLVAPDPSDRHMDFVTNEPSLTASVLIGRLVENETSLESIQAAFPDRSIYIYDAKTKQLQIYRSRLLR